MTKQSKNTTRYKGVGKMFYWDLDMKQDFERLIRRYDPDLSANSAIKKLVRWAIAEGWIPGYAKREKVIENSTVKALDALKPEKTFIEPPTKFYY